MTLSTASSTTSASTTARSPPMKSSAFIKWAPPPNITSQIRLRKKTLSGPRDEEKFFLEKRVGEKKKKKTRKLGLQKNSLWFLGRLMQIPSMAQPPTTALVMG